MSHRYLPVLSVLTLVNACGTTDPQSAFTEGRSAITCNAAVPVCTTFAGCTLDEKNYTQGSFTQGAAVRFIVHTSGAATISVELLFTSERSPGVDTEVTWKEAACAQSATSSSGGTDVFAEAGASRVWKRSQKVFTAGDHLVDLFSDAQADYLLRVEVLPGT